MEIGLYMLLAVLGIGFLALVGYDMKNKSQHRMAELQLERERIALETKKLDFKG